ncbi:MAG: threonine/serine dehydratase [Acidobacteriota bacterium]|nr:threonine/serine dehydratase [Acidobacteriota bacterium]
MSRIDGLMVEEASQRIRHYALDTDLTFSPVLSSQYSGQLGFKWESHQPTGSFKIRGAASKILANLEECRRRGVITASTGNHGAATACICRGEGLKLIIYVPATISKIKRQKLEKSGAGLRLVEGSCEQAEALARQAAGTGGQVFISPYNDELVIAGQGTCGLEILRDWPEVEEVLVPVGGGGLIAGVAIYLKEKKPGIKITGVEPENSAFIKHSLTLGRLSNDFPEKPTIAEAVAGGLESDSMTFDLIRHYVDRLLTVSEESISQAMKIIYQDQQEKVEGAGALSVAGWLSASELFSGKKTVAIVSGGNIEPARWEELTGYQ